MKTEEIIIISLAIALITYVIFKTVSSWMNNPKKMWSSNNANKLNKKTKTITTPLTTSDKQTLLPIDIISIIYWAVFGLILFSIFQPLYGAGQAQNGMQAILLGIIAIPGSIILFVVFLRLFFKKNIVNKKVWESLLITFLLPFILILVGITVIISISESLYSNEFFYKLALNSPIEPFIRVGIILIALALINKKRISRMIESCSE